MKEKEKIELLNDLVKGEEMAVEAYQSLLEFDIEQPVKDTLKNMQQSHQNMLNTLSSKIVELGDTPNYGTGPAGLFAGAKLKMDKMGSYSSEDVLGKACQGEENGVEYANKLRVKAIDQESTDLLNQIYEADKQNASNIKNQMQ